MYCYICVITSFLINFVYTSENNSACITPNGESGVCVVIDACDVIKRSIAYFDADAIDFARKSQCNYINDKPWVCCGSTGKYTTTGSPVSEFVTKGKSIPKSVDHVLLPDSTLCGLQVSENKKTNINAEINEYPWLVALKYINNDGSDEGFMCSGTLINDRYVLTAAQCLHIPKYNLVAVRLGESDFKSFQDCVEDPEETCSNYQDINITKTVPHVFYNETTGNNNIALLRLEKRVQYSDYVRAICLPPNEYSAAPLGTTMQFSGWIFGKDGKLSDVKLKSQIYVEENNVCMKSFPNDKNVGNDHFCVSSTQTVRDPCFINSGSPIMRNYTKTDISEEEQFFQEGIIFGGTYCLQKNLPIVYTRVSKYTNWILNNLSK